MLIKIFGIILVSCNLLSFLLFFIDKKKAIKKSWRISEKALILSAFAMGALGGTVGMRLCHHKTNKIKFKVVMPLAIVTNVFMILGFFYLNNYFCDNTIFML